MNRQFLAGIAIIIVATVCISVPECSGWAPPLYIDSDWKVYAPVGVWAIVDAWVESGGPVYLPWSWNWESGGYQDQYDEEYSSMSWGQYSSSGIYDVYVYASSAGGSQFTTSWSTGGTKTVTATCGSSSAQKQVTIVEVASVASDVNEACDGENVTFTVTTNPAGYGSPVSWSGGGTPTTGSGLTFITKWSTGGTKTVTATCGSSSKSKQVTILAGCDCTRAGGDWVSWFPISSCDLYNGPADEEERPDNCKNTIKQDCSGGSGSYAFHWYYNGSNIGTCIWHNGGNSFQYRLTINGYRYHSTRHSTLHQCNSTSCPKYPAGRYGCADSGYYCWKVTYHDYISGGNTTTWRRSTSYPTSIWADDGVDCPDGAHH